MGATTLPVYPRPKDYSLLLGSVGLFLILALVMYVTRGIDWYGARGGSAPAGPPPVGPPPVASVEG
jgi:hypothetical protein